MEEDRSLEKSLTTGGVSTEASALPKAGEQDGSGEVSRRAFLRFGALAGASASVPGFLQPAVDGQAPAAKSASASFTLRLTFSGIVAFVSNIRTESDYKTFVVLPGLEGAKYALDDEFLCPHNSYIESTTSALTLERTSLRGLRATLNLARASSPPDSGLPQAVIDMPHLLGSLCVPNDGIFERQSPPRPFFVMTQVLLPAGQWDCRTDVGWRIEPVKDGGAPIQPTLAHEVTFIAANLTGAELALEALDGSESPPSLTLAPGFGSDTAEVGIINTCKELEPVGKGERSLRDRDFKWYYELLHQNSKDKIRRDLGARDLPIPRRLTRGALEQVLAHDCFPGKLGEYGF